jgi:hypothetical protein
MGEDVIRNKSSLRPYLAVIMRGWLSSKKAWYSCHNLIFAFLFLYAFIHFYLLALSPFKYARFFNREVIGERLRTMQLSAARQRENETMNERDREDF